MTPFGEKLRTLRRQRGLSLKKMAEDLHLSSAYLSALEHGHRGRPSPGLVMQILGYFNVIWDEAEELKELAYLSHPKVTLDTSGLSPSATPPRIHPHGSRVRTRWRLSLHPVLPPSPAES